MTLRSLFLTIPLLLAACGDLPEPFLGNPGATARRLAVPATPLLAVPPPKDALLPPGSGQGFADRLAEQLQKEEVPALARPAGKNDWRLAVSAERKGETIVPRYAVQDPAGKEQGTIDGAPLPTADWTAAAPATLDRAARDGVAKVVALLTSVKATRDRADPNSLLNRAARLYVPEVTGAPGDGNVALTKAIRGDLPQFGPLVQVTPEATDFTVRGTVSAAALPNAQQRIEIVWTVTRPSGVVVGKVSQLNAVPAGSLSQFWGEVAVVVAQEAADGIFRVVERFAGKDPDKHIDKRVDKVVDAAPGKSPDTSAGTSSGSSAGTSSGKSPGKPPPPGKPPGKSLGMPTGKSSGPKPGNPAPPPPAK